MFSDRNGINGHLFVNWHHFDLTYLFDTCHTTQWWMESGEKSGPRKVQLLYSLRRFQDTNALPGGLRFVVVNLACRPTLEPFKVPDENYMPFGPFSVESPAMRAGRMMTPWNDFYSWIPFWGNFVLPAACSFGFGRNRPNTDLL